MNGGLVWRLLPYQELSGPDNMALDHAMADTASPREALLRFYGWSSPTISLGRNQPAAGRYDLDRVRGLGIQFVRRPTGGRAVLHDHEVTYSVVFPARELGGLRRAYRLINEALVAGLALLGVQAGLAASTLARRRPSLRACFDGSAEGEVVVGGRKLLGSAQARIGGTVLQHGSLLLSGDQALLAQATGVPLEHAPVTLSELVDPVPAHDEVTDALARGFSEVVGTRPEPGVLDGALASRSLELSRRYNDPAWTWRC
jgi:lipoate-protein ligase A